MARLPQAATAAAALGLGPRDDVFAVFDAICDLYARSEPPDCAAIRSIVHEHEARLLLDDYLGYASRILKKGGRPEWLELEQRIGGGELHAPQLVGGKPIQRLPGRNPQRRFQQLAAAAHLDPSPVLKRIAERSNPDRHAAAPTATRQALGTFEDSAYFAVSIMPRLH